MKKIRPGLNWLLSNTVPMTTLPRTYEDDLLQSAYPVRLEHETPLDREVKEDGTLITWEDSYGGCIIDIVASEEMRSYTGVNGQLNALSAGLWEAAELCFPWDMRPEFLCSFELNGAYQHGNLMAGGELVLEFVVAGVATLEQLPLVASFRYTEAALSHEEYELKGYRFLALYLFLQYLHHQRIQEQ